jgi:glycosyltransferase involved in cell wall biosynthesis
MQALVNLDNGVAVSIVIPARDEEENLSALLASLASLDFPRERLEIIVVDHESTDRTGEIARSAGARVLLKTGGTISSARNFGASRAAAQILAFLDADCTVAEDWLERALGYFADTKVGIVGSYYVVPLEPSTWVRRVLQAQTVARPRSSEGKWVPAGNMLIRKKVYWECGGFDESLVTCEDVDLCYRVAQKYRVIEDTAIRCFHHGEPKTLRQVFRKELWRGRDNLLGVLRHGLRWDEVPSLVLPLYAVVTLGLFLSSPLLGALTHWGAWTVLGAGGLFLLPLVLLAALTGIRAGDVRCVPQLTLLFGVYFLARGLAPFYRWRYV